MSEQAKNVITPERLEALHQQYPIPGGIAFSDQRVTTWHFDQHGNELRVTRWTGGEITYEERGKADG